MKLPLENEKEIMDYITGIKALNEKYSRLEGLVKSIINDLPKHTQRRIKKILSEEKK